MQLPQIGRWLPGYGFVVWTIQTKHDPNGKPYPCAVLRDPYDCYPGYYGTAQQPEELGVIRRIPESDLVQMYPELKGYFNKSNLGFPETTIFSFEIIFCKTFLFFSPQTKTKSDKFKFLEDTLNEV